MSFSLLAESVLDINQTINTLRFMGPLKVQSSVTRPRPINSPDDPATWDNETLRNWVTATYPKVCPDILCPTESGKQLCRIPEGEFIERCMRCDGVTEKKAKAFYLKLWRLLVDARTKQRAQKMARRPGKAEAEKEYMAHLEKMARNDL